MKRFTIKNRKDAKNPYVVIVDNTDASYLRNHVWKIITDKTGNLYLCRDVNGETVLLHKILVGAKENQRVHFIDGNSLNIQRSNLLVMKKEEWLKQYCGRSCKKSPKG